MVTAAIVTIGNEILSGDVANTNASWLAQRLQELGIVVRLVAVVPDEIDEIAPLVRDQAARTDFVLVTGGLGGTPDDVTREAIAAAFEVEQREVPELAADLRSRFARDPEYAARWAQLPSGSRGFANPHGGAPGFAIRNVFVFPGLPSELVAMFETVEDEFRGGPPIRAWRRTYRTHESEIASLLAEATERWPGVLVGSYPSFEPPHPEVQIVLKSSDEAALAEAGEFVATAMSFGPGRSPN